MQLVGHISLRGSRTKDLFDQEYSRTLRVIDYTEANMTDIISAVS